MTERTLVRSLRRHSCFRVHRGARWIEVARVESVREGLAEGMIRVTAHNGGSLLLHPNSMVEVRR